MDTTAAGGCWVAARLVREYWPCGADAQSEHPEVEVADPRFRIFRGFGADGRYIVGERVSRAELTAGGEPDVKPDGGVSQYVIPSDDGVVFLVVGPEHAPGGAPNVRVRWGADPRGVAVVTAHEHNRPYRAELRDGGGGWQLAALPLLRSFGDGAPPRAGPGCKAKAAIEVCTNVRWCAGGGAEHVMEARLEHHAPQRVAWRGWWLKGSTAAATERRGYAGDDPGVLACQAAAAKGWMFAAAEVMLDSGWAAAIHSAGIGRVKLMGFETNNPLHDDHEGRGAHWHPTVRHAAEHPGGAKRARYASGPDPTPHLYLDDGGRVDVSGARHAAQLPADNRAGGSCWRLEACAALLEPSGALAMAPLVSLQSAAEPDAGCLHVRQSWASAERGRQFQLLRGADAEGAGSNWAVEFVAAAAGAGLPPAARVVALRSARCGGYLHVRESAPRLRAQGDGWAALMLLRDGRAEGSRWVLEELGGGSCRLRSCRTAQYLDIRPEYMDLEQGGRKECVLQLADSAGAGWRLRAAHDGWVSGPPAGSTLRHSYELAIERSSRRGCRVAVLRDGVGWVSVDVEMDTDAGSVSVCTRRACDGALAKPPLHISFDPLTGCVRGTRARVCHVPCDAVS